jgi:3-dehydroquinate synthase
MNYTIDALSYLIEIGSLTDSSFEFLINDQYLDSKKIILVDENTNEYCLDYLLTNFSSLQNAEVILIPEGEENKTLDICSQIWETWAEYGVERGDLLINLGGGVISDLGGFLASVYMRGISYINIPTTLLAMIDASIGGKNGVDLGNNKNMLGTFSVPEAVFIDPGFLSTLSEGEWYNGFAEMLKHGVCNSEQHWKDCIQLVDVPSEMNVELMYASILIKNTIVLEDPYDKGLRKKLNFGHTIGHGLEGYFLDKDPISHGYAVALGMLAEAFISFKRSYLTLSEFSEIENVISIFYLPIDLTEVDYSDICKIIQNDKKNKGGKVKCVLLIGIGQAVIDKEIETEEILSAIEFLNRKFLESKTD